MEFINCDNPYLISQHYADLESTHKDRFSWSTQHYCTFNNSGQLNFVKSQFFTGNITDVRARSVNASQIFYKLWELEKLIYKCHFSSTTLENSLDLEGKTFKKAAWLVGPKGNLVLCCFSPQELLHCWSWSFFPPVFQPFPRRLCVCIPLQTLQVLFAHTG